MRFANSMTPRRGVSSAGTPTLPASEPSPGEVRPRRSLALAICQAVHRVEWFKEDGVTRRNGARDNACLDCVRLACAAADYLSEALTSAEGYEALQGGPAAVVELIGGAS